MKKKTKVTIFAFGAIMFAGVTFITQITAATATAVEIADMPWDESNVAVLRSASVADVEKFANRVQCGEKGNCAPINVRQFVWADLEGNGKYALVNVWVPGRRAEAVGIYQRNSSGKIQKNDGDLTPAVMGYSTQSIDVDDAYEDLTDAIRDLNGDGKKELLINCGFGMGRDMAENPVSEFPLVYRLQDGKYVEASREFPSFYDKEVLPPLEKQIVELQKQLDSEAKAKASGEAVMKEYHWNQPDIDSHTSPEQAKAVADSEQLALLESLRNHIQRLLGRGPTVQEENEARDWLKSQDVRLVEFAEQAFEEMGGYKSEAHEAEQKLRQM